MIGLLLFIGNLALIIVFLARIWFLERRARQLKRGVINLGALWSEIDADAERIQWRHDHYRAALRQIAQRGADEEDRCYAAAVLREVEGDA